MGLSRDDMRCHLLSAFCSGFVASLCSTPADVAKSRIMNQKRTPDGSVLYKGTFHCWATTVNEEGFLALYKGFFPGW
jgi:solute carrier family 25 uncoupling protein 27